MPRTGIHNRLGNLKQENPMNVNHYIGFDVHKKSISYCVKTADGTIVEESTLRATHLALREWAQKRREPWHGAMEATLFSGWIYDMLKPYAVELQMGHPAMMKAIGASKKKNDKLDARKTADLVRCHLLPVCYVAPREIRELRRMLRYRKLVVAQATRMKNKMSGLLMEVGADYNKQRLHTVNPGFGCFTPPPPPLPAALRLPESCGFRMVFRICPRPTDRPPVCVPPPDFRRGYSRWVDGLHRFAKLDPLKIGPTHQRDQTV